MHLALSTSTLATRRKNARHGQSKKPPNHQKQPNNQTNISIVMAKTAEATRARAGAQDMKSVDLRKVLPPLSQVRPRFIRQLVSQSVSQSVR